MNVNLLTEDQARTIAKESSEFAIQSFIDKFFPGFPKTEQIQESTTDQLMTVKELAAYWKVQAQTIRKKKLNGSLPFIQHGRTILFSKAKIDKLTANPVSKSGR